MSAAEEEEAIRKGEDVNDITGSEKIKDETMSTKRDGVKVLNENSPGLKARGSSTPPTFNEPAAIKSRR